MLLEDKVALITGGRRGIGYATALAFGAEGAHLALADLDQVDVKRAAAQVAERGSRAIGLAADVSQQDQAEALVSQTVAEFGRLDILVNCAGIIARSGILEATEEQWDSVLGVNLKGTFFCSRAAADHMVARGGGGAIVNIASVAAAKARLDNVVYSASKAGVTAVTRAFALELAPHGVRVNAIAPGPTDTDMVRVSRTEEELERMWRGELKAYRLPIPIGRILTAEDQAKAVLFLASDLASAVTGQVLHVDGGLTAM